MKTTPRILYLSHDGMTDPLGQSQVIAYLKRLSRQGFAIDIVSYEKPGIYEQRKDLILSEIKDTGITWYPLTYGNGLPLISTLQLLQEGWKQITALHARHPYQVVHCRAQLMAILGNRLRKKFGVKLIFDMRGWWTDEKFESGNWNIRYLKPLYNYLKRSEQRLFREADSVVSLTHKGKEEITRHGWAPGHKVGVIPTCVDFDLFKPFDPAIRAEVRSRLGIAPDAFVLIYSGSLGGAYKVSDILHIYNVLQTVQPKAQLVLLAKSLQGTAAAEIEAFNATAAHKVLVTSAEFKEVHRYLMAADLGLILYEKTYSVIGRSPTKLGEYWASGIPVLSPAGIGDVDFILTKYPGSGSLIGDLASGASILGALQEVTARPAAKDLLRSYAIDYYDINKGISFYKGIYEQLVSGKEINEKCKI